MNQASPQGATRAGCGRGGGGRRPLNVGTGCWEGGGEPHVTGFDNGPPALRRLFSHTLKTEGSALLFFFCPEGVAHLNHFPCPLL